MTRRPWRNHSPAFKAKMALAAIRGEKTLAELAQQFDEPPNQITQWRSQLLEGASGLFGAAALDDAALAIDVKTLRVKIGELTLENDFLSVALGKADLLPSADDDRPRPPAERQSAGEGARDQPGRRLLPAAPNPGRRSRAEFARRVFSYRHPDAHSPGDRPWRLRAG